VVAVPQTWEPTIGAVGTLNAVNGVMVSTDLAGVVSEIAFESGQQIKKGEVLVQLDSRQEEAQLQSANARLDLAKTDLKRKEELVQKKAIAPAEFDTAQSELRQAEAAVEEAKAVIARKRIVAPFDGVLGIRDADMGQYLNAGAAIVQLESLDPIYVDFSIPQHALVDVRPGSKLRLRAGGAESSIEAVVTAVDARVDAATRNIRVQGTARNPDHTLRPGMFADVEVLLPPKEGVIAIPSSSVSYAPYGDSVYIVKDRQGDDGKSQKYVEQHFVKLGPTRGDQVSVLSGISQGDEVVSSAVFKLRPDAPVVVNNEVQPGNELNPQPADN
jgi:membrane fusion protein (multidrug efflux system)